MLKADEFSSVFSFRRSVFGEFFQIQARPNGMIHPRLGMIVSKRIERLAVHRNFAKRTIREVFRAHCGELGGLDLVVRLKKPMRRENAPEARRELCKLVGRAAHVTAPDRTD